MKMGGCGYFTPGSELKAPTRIPRKIWDFRSPPPGTPGGGLG